MGKLKPSESRICPEAFRSALAALDVAGAWEWDAATNNMRSDAVVAMLFNVDPEEAEAGVPITVFQAAIHPDDRDRLRTVVRSSAWNGTTHLTEYRVTSVDGRIRRVLARFRFYSDAAGRAVGGNGIIMDITGLRIGEDLSDGAAGYPEETPLERAAEHAIAAREAILELHDPRLEACADALLMALGRRLARREVEARRGRMH